MSHHAPLAAAAALLLVLPSAATAAPDQPAPEQRDRPAAPDAPPATPVSPPSLRKNVPVALPPGTAFPAPEVTVTLSLEVGADGKVAAASVEQGAGEPFDGAALTASRQLEFEPARLADGSAVPVIVSFRLRILAPPPEKPRPAPVRLSGRLLEKGTRRPLADVPVEARAGERSLAAGTTDAAGRFSLTVDGGGSEFALVAVPSGHVRLEVAVRAAPGEERDETFYLPAIVGGYQAVVRGERVQREITRQVIPAQEVELVAGSQGDALKAVLNLPGAARASYGGAQLVLRGSSPGDSAAFIDGLQVPVLYHFGGLRSTFAPRFLESIEFIPGNFAPDYGRLSGGIVNVRVRAPAADMVRGEADFNLYDAGVAVEGPLGAGWNGGASFRRSWVDAILPAVLPRDATLSFTSAPRFYDYQFIATRKLDERSELRLLFFGSQDKLVAIFKRPAGDPTITGDLQTRVAFHDLAATWSSALSPTVKQESQLALGLQGFDFSVGSEFLFKVDTWSLDARSTWSWQARPWLEARAGLDLQAGLYRVDLDLPQPPQEGEPPTPISTIPRVVTSQRGELISPAVFAELQMTASDGLAILPSVRVDHASLIGRWSVDPRLSARWSLPGDTVLKAAAGVYHQPPDPSVAARDIGTPELLPRRSYQFSAGLERRLLPGLDLDATAFYKALSRNVVRNPDPTAATRYVNDGVGRVYGLEALLRARFGERFFGWIAYTFQRSLRTDSPGAPERRFDFDQPHILTAVATWKRSDRWTYGARFRLVSGNPYTPVVGEKYFANADVYVPIYAGVNTGRLAAFHALDLRIDRTWTYDRWRLSAYLDVQNVYNHASQEGWQYSFDYRERTPATGLPILPIAGVKGEW